MIIIFLYGKLGIAELVFTSISIATLANNCTETKQANMLISRAKNQINVTLPGSFRYQFINHIKPNRHICSKILLENIIYIFDRYKSFYHLLMHRFVTWLKCFLYLIYLLQLVSMLSYSVNLALSNIFVLNVLASSHKTARYNLWNT